MMLDCFGIELTAQDLQNWDDLTAGRIGHPESKFKGFRVRDPLPTPETCHVADHFFTITLPLAPHELERAWVLEVGCGASQYAESVIALGGRYMGVDISHHAVAVSNESYRLCAPGFQGAYHTVDDRDAILEHEGIFDIVFGADFFIHQPDDRYAAIAGFAARMLREGGVFCAERWMGTMYTVETEQPGVDWRGFQRPRAQEEAALAAVGLEVERYHLTPMKNGLDEDDREVLVAKKVSA